MSEDEFHWQAVAARDAALDGASYYGVASTGVYCRPSCPSRRPRRRNVRFFGTAEEAESAGFRACLRCRPRAVVNAEAERIAALCGSIERHLDERLALDVLSREAGLSPFHIARHDGVRVSERRPGHPHPLPDRRHPSGRPAGRRDGQGNPLAPTPSRGATATYGEVAAALANPKAASAVGRACAANPVALAIPCHRVIRGDGGLGGYRWGLECKRLLLAAEREFAAATARPAGRP